jgi:hypothetical protein
MNSLILPMTTSSNRKETIMGMDVMGKNPKNETGEYFRNNMWWWPPLAIYVCQVAPEIAAKCKYWQSNDGDGLDGEASMLLADLLQKEIDSGRTERYARLRQSQIEQAPNEPCSLCEGTGTHKPAPERGAGDPTKDGIVCNSCDGNGYVRPWVDNYSFSVENVQEFANFLRDCSGFEIW